MPFDPDKFLSGGTATVTPEAPKTFDPDAFLAGPTDASPPGSIDEWMYWSKKFNGVDYAKNRMSDADKAGFAQLAKVTDNSADSQKQAINMAYVSKLLPDIPLGVLQKHWPAARKAFASSALQLNDEELNDANLYEAINKRVNELLQSHWVEADSSDRLPMMVGHYEQHRQLGEKIGMANDEPWLGSEAAGTKGLFTIPKMEGTGVFPGLINAANRFSSALSTLENIELMVGTEGLGELATGAKTAVTAAKAAGNTAEAIKAAKVALVTKTAQAAVVGTFTAQGAMTTKEAYNRAKLVWNDPNSTSAARSESLGFLVLNAATTAVAAKGTFDIGKGVKTDFSERPKSAAAEGQPQQTEQVPTPEKAQAQEAQKVQTAELLRDEANKQPAGEVKEVLTDAAHQIHPHAQNGPQITEIEGGFVVTDAIGNHIDTVKTIEEAHQAVEKANAARSPEKAPESPETGKTAGIAHRVSEAQGMEAPRGKGINIEETLDETRKSYTPEAAEDAMKAFEADPEGSHSTKMIAMVRIHDEALTRAANEAAETFGDNSPEEQAATRALEDWKARVKKIQTASSDAFRIQQGETEIDTGTFRGMTRAVRESTKDEANPQGKEVTEAQKEKIKQHVASVREATKAETDAAKEVADQGKKATSDEVAQPKKSRPNKYLAEKAAEARARIKAFQERQTAPLGKQGGAVINPAEVAALFRDHAIIGAEYIAKGVTEFGEWSKEMVKEFGDYVKPHLQDLFERSKQTRDELETERQRAIIDARQSTIETRIKELKEKLASGDLSAPEKKANRPEIPELETLVQERQGLQDELTRLREREAKIGELKKAIAEKNKKIAQGDLSTKGQPQNRPAQDGIEQLKQQRDALNKQLDALRNPPKAKNPPMSDTEKGSRLLDRQIAELERQIKSQEIFPKGKTPKAENPALAGKKAQLEQLKYERENMRDTIRGDDIEPPSTPADVVASHKTGSKWTPEQAKALWKRGAELIDSGMSYDDMRHQLAKEFNLPVNDVTEGLASPKGMREVTDEMYRKMDARRKAQNAAKAWVMEQKYPGYQKIFNNVHQGVFDLYTALHGTAWFTTHAAINLFVPKVTGPMILNLGRAFRMMGDKAYHERMMQDMVRDPLFIKAKRAKLANDPFQNTDAFQNSGTVKIFREIGLIGNRGFDGLKLLRQFRFNQEWATTPPELRTDLMAKIYSEGINKATGHSDLKGFPKGLKGIFFAPGLEASKWAMQFTDPAKDSVTLARSLYDKENMSPEEVKGAQQRVKFAVQAVGTYLGLLTLNQAILSATGSDQEINFTDPLHGGDWLYFKGFGMKSTPLAGLMRPMTYLMRLTHDFWGERSKYEQMEASRAGQAAKDTGEYLRSKLHPAYGLAADAVTGSDFQGNTMPWNDDKIPKYEQREGAHQYTAAEYAATHLAPIPWAEAAKEVWTEQGIGEAQQKEWMAAMRQAFMAATTATRVSEDKAVHKDSTQPEWMKKLLPSRNIDTTNR